MWDYVIHNRISNYFRMYTQHLNFSNFLLVSHRNMISVYRKTTSPQEDGWVDTIKFNEGYVRNMFMKKRSKIEMDSELSLSKGVSRMTDFKTGEKKLSSVYKKFYIMSLVGTSTIYYNMINAQGCFERENRV